MESVLNHVATESPAKEQAAIKVRAVMTTPRLGWEDHHDEAANALVYGGQRIPVKQIIGGFWHQNIQQLLEDAIADGVTWVLTIDYDSLFDQAHVCRLIDDFMANPHVDALAALQCKRGVNEGAMMFGAESRDGLYASLHPCQTAHFGLTLLRLDRLKGIPKPWFLPTPNGDGSWREGSVDADIYFWNKWSEHGRNCYVDTDVSIAHLQVMATEVDSDGEIQTIHVSEWQERRARRVKELCSQAVESAGV